MDLHEFLRHNPNLPVDLVQQEHFPDVDLWTIRQARRDVQSASALAAVDGPSVLGSAAMKGLSSQAKMALHAGFFRPVKVELLDRPPVKPLFKKNGDTYLVLSDIHAPDIDKHALDVAIQVGQSLPLTAIIINGDGFDVHSLSQYTPSAHKAFRWVDERIEAVKVFILLRELFPTTPIYFLFGNHDIRPETFLARVAPQLQGVFTLPQFLGIDGLDFIFPENNRVILGDTLVKHGEKVRQEAGASVAQEIRDESMSVVMGHVHRLAQISVTRGSHRIRDEQPWVGVELGCLCNLRPDYLATEKGAANWQHGFAVLTLHDSGLVKPELVEIWNGVASFRGREFRSRHLPKVA